MKARSFLFKLFWMAFASLASMYAFTAFVDPHQQFGFNEINKCAMPSALLDNSVLLEKKKNSFEFFILGSSRVGYIEPSLIETITKQKAFKFGVPAASLEDYLAIINQIAHTQKAKTIYLQLDFFSFKDRPGRRRRILMSPLGKYLQPFIDLKELNPTRILFFEKTYFSLKAFIDAIKALKGCLKNIKGNDPPKAPIKKIQKENLENDPPRDVQPPTQKPPEGKVRLRKEYFQDMYQNYSINEARLKERLGVIKKIADENEIKLLVGLSPMNREHLAKVQKEKDLVEILLRVKKILVEIFGAFYDFNNCSATTFQGLSYWYDSVHPTAKLARIIVHRILNQQTDVSVPEYFGVAVTRKNVEGYLSQSHHLCSS